MSIMSLPLSCFRPVLLQDIKADRFDMEKSNILKLAQDISRNGLYHPILIGEKVKRLRVKDGHKRLLALFLLKEKEALPRSLVDVPCTAVPTDISNERPSLKTEAELVDEIIAAKDAGQSVLKIARENGCTEAFACQALMLKNLHAQIMEYFRAGHLGLEQAAAFAAMPNKDSQWRLLQELGPFAHASEVIAAMLKGDTVIETPDGNVHILPSREKYSLSSFDIQFG